VSPARKAILTLLSAVVLALGPGGSAATTVPAFDEDAMTDIQTRGIGPQTSKVTQNAKQWAKFHVHLTTDRKAYRIGDLMDIRIQADRDCYVMVYYVSSEGKTSVICPSPFSTRNRLRAGRTFRLLDNRGRKLQQLGPPGSELLQVVATERQLDLKALLAKKQGVRPKAPTPAAVEPSPAPSVQEPSPSETPAPSAGVPDSTAQGPERRYDENGNPIDTAPPTPAPASVGEPTPVSDPGAFVHDTVELIRGLVLQRSRSIAARGIGPGTTPTKKDSVYGLASMRYRVTAR